MERLTDAQRDLAAEYAGDAFRRAASLAKRFPRLDDRCLDAVVSALVEAASTYDPRRGLDFGPWVGWLQRRRVIDALRASRRPAPALSLDASPEVYDADPALAARDPDPLAVGDALGLLRPQDAELVSDLVLSGRTQTELAEGDSTERVRLSRRYRAAIGELRQRLRD